MFVRVAAALVIASASFSACAAQDVQEVVGTIWENGATRVAFNLKLAAEDSQKVPLADGRVLEVIRSSLIGTFMQIVDAAGKPQQSVALGKDSADKTVRFALCEQGSVEISSPARTQEPNCAKR